MRMIDCTPTYLGHNLAMDRIARTYANAKEPPKFIVAVRDPVERAVSHWAHAVVMSQRHRRLGDLDHWTVKLVRTPMLCLLVCHTFDGVMTLLVMPWCAACIGKDSAPCPTT